MARLNRRDFFFGASGLAVGAFATHFASRYWLFNYTLAGKQYVLQQKQERLTRQLIPEEGKTIRVALNAAGKTLVDHGVIDIAKWNAIYSKRKIEMPKWIEKSFFSESREPIHLDPVSAPFLLNILWALGISNKTKFNEQSPLQGKRLGRFASTGGWLLGKEKAGTAYFNKVVNVQLDDAQDKLVHKMAKSIYRPCCNNSTFFQDCNHGSAMLGLLQLGASQGRSEIELYSIALTANSYWFPRQYSNVALYFEEIEGRSMDEVSPRKVLSLDYSSASGFKGNVTRKLAEKDLLPRSRRGRAQGCSV